MAQRVKEQASRAATVAEPERPTHLAVARTDPASPRAQRLLDGWGWTLLRLATDTVMLVTAVIAALVGAAATDLSLDGARVMWLFVPLTVGLLALSGAYDGALKPRMFHRAWQICGVTSIAAMLIVVVDAFATASSDLPPLVGRVWFFGAVSVIGGRVVLKDVQRRARNSGAVGSPTLIVGAGKIGAQVERRLLENSWLGMRPVGFLDADRAAARSASAPRAPILGTPAEFAAVADATSATHVVVGFLPGSDDALVPLIRAAQDRGMRVSLVPRLFERTNVRSELAYIGGLPLFHLGFVDPGGAWFALKHVLDRLIAAAVLVATAPLLLIIAAVIKLTTREPVFFTQERVGKGGKTFQIIKFRTMTGSPAVHGEADAAWAAAAVAGVAGEASSPSLRATRCGRFLRRHSLDELPQLFNVLAGDMSLVGPRPERPHYVQTFEHHFPGYGDRHRVRPGMTGWAQVQGLRGNTSLADRVEWDNHYIDNWTPSFDLKILLMTFDAVRRPAS